MLHILIFGIGLFGVFGLKAIVNNNDINYGDPFARNCLQNERNISIESISGSICAPICDFNNCPPSKTKAEPLCNIEGPTNMYCGLICNTSFQCSENATCKSIENTGLCTFNI